LRAGFWAKDRGVATILLREIGEFWGTESLGEIVERANERPGPDFAALAPIVAKCAEARDELAEAVLERAGQELAEQVALVALKMSESGSQGEIGVAYTGGILEHIAPVRQSLVAALKRSTPQATVMKGAADSLKGALWRARDGGLPPAKK
jgi:glucosamine kinase